MGTRKTTAGRSRPRDWPRLVPDGTHTAREKVALESGREEGNETKLLRR